MPKKAPKNSSSKENLGIFGVDLMRHADMKVSFEKEVAEKLEPFIQTAKKAQEFVERIKEASKPKTYLMYTPPKPLTRRDLEEVVTAKKLGKPRKNPIVLVFERKTSAIFKKDEPDKAYSVARAPLCKKVLTTIRLEFTPTADLAKQLDSTIRSIQSSINKINRMAIQHLSLKGKIILGKEIAGYRLNPIYSLIKK